MEDIKDKKLAKFRNEYEEPYEIWIKDGKIGFTGSETNWEFMSFDEDFIFNQLESRAIIKILALYINTKIL